MIFFLRPAPDTVPLVSSKVLQSIGATTSPPITPSVLSSTVSPQLSVTSQTLSISSSSSLTSNPSVTPTVLGYTDCPASNYTLYSSQGLNFTLVCGLEWSIEINDLTPGGVNATTLDACMDICAYWAVNQDGDCKGAVYHIQPSSPGGSPLCFLKSLAPSPSVQWRNNSLVAGGFLNQGT